MECRMGKLAAGHVVDFKPMMLTISLLVSALFQRLLIVRSHSDDLKVGKALDLPRSLNAKQTEARGQQRTVADAPSIQRAA